MTETTESLDTSGPVKSGRARKGEGLSSMVLPDLKALAGQLGIRGTSGMRKGDLVAAIVAKQGAGATSPTKEPRRSNGGANGSSTQPSANGHSGGDPVLPLGDLSGGRPADRQDSPPPSSASADSAAAREHTRQDAPSTTRPLTRHNPVPSGATGTGATVRPTIRPGTVASNPVAAKPMAAIPAAANPTTASAVTAATGGDVGTVVTSPTVPAPARTQLRTRSRTVPPRRRRSVTGRARTGTARTGTARTARAGTTRARVGTVRTGTTRTGTTRTGTTRTGTTRTATTRARTATTRTGTTGRVGRTGRTPT